MLNAKLSQNNVIQMDKHFVLILELVQLIKRKRIVLEKEVVEVLVLVFGTLHVENKNVLKLMLHLVQMLNVIILSKDV